MTPTENKESRRARKAEAIAKDAAATPEERDTASKIAAELDRKARIKEAAEKKKAEQEANAEPKSEDAKSEPASDGKVSIADIAKVLGVDPKLARAKLRRLAAKGELPPGMECVDGRWVRVTPGDKLHTFLMATFAPMKTE